ncbi:hypothetical protein ACRAWD_23990 [Caulobacter segnis]
MWNTVPLLGVGTGDAGSSLDVSVDGGDFGKGFVAAELDGTPDLFGKTPPSAIR